MQYNKTLLNVSSKSDNNQILSKFLQSTFKTVITTNNGNDVFDKFISEKPDIIITSIEMDNQNGIEVIKSIRKIDKKIPIIVISKHANEKELTKNIDTLVDYIFPIFVNEQVLTKAIKHLLANNHAKNADSVVVDNHKPQDTSLKNNSLIIVGIGASAGGLEALTQLMHSLPMDNNSAYIIAQHLSPTHKTMLVELLSRETKLKVKNAENMERLIANTVYITPPNKNIELNEQNKIILTTPDKNSIQPKPSINVFFLSLAKVKKEHAIGIILSGTGTDGTQGMRAIKAGGGITIVQNPESAKYDSMPKSAIDDSSVDIIINPSKMGDELVALANFPKERVLDKYKVSAPIDELNTIYSALYKHTKIDFSVYKKNTLIRRIERRMFARKTSTLSEYTTLVQNDKDEIDNLFKDILIGVTRFFRDKDAFEALIEKIKDYIEANKDLEKIRVWVAGTSTGEEAYSVLFAIHEALDILNKDIDIIIFATDVDKTALKTARKAVYSVASLTEVSKERVTKYFKISEDGYEIKKQYREQVIFSYHNLLGDPPFKNIDIVTCRNLLIYFDTDAQNYVMPTFHYALNNNGLLFLGQSENITSYDNLFAPADSRSKIFKRVKSSRKSNAPQNTKSPIYNLPQAETVKTNVSHNIAKSSPLHEAVIEEATKIILPNTIVVSEQMEVIYKKGDLSFLSVPEGYVTYNIYKMVDSKVALDLRGLINRIKNDEETVSSALIPVNNNDGINFLKVYATKLSNRHNPVYVFYFMEISKDLDSK